MGLTNKLGQLSQSIQQDSSNNIGIGGAVNASYKLTVTGTTLTTGAATFSSNLAIGGESNIYGGLSGLYAIQNGNASFYSYQTESGLISNAYYNSGWKYKTTNLATRILGLTGNFQFDTAISGTADAALTWNTRMYISNTGNVGILTSSPSYKLDIRNDVAASTSLEPISLGLYNGSDGGSAIYFRNSVGGQSKISFGVESTGSGTDDTYLAFSTGANTTLSERMRITSAGNLNFNTAGSGAAYIVINQPTNQDGGVVWQRNGNNRFQQTLNTPSDGMQFYSYGIGTTAFIINYGGSASLYGALTQNASDKRLKNNIVNIPNALEKINTLNGVNFTWDNTIYKTDRTNDIGIIAQEIQAVLPEAVTLAPFDNDGEGNSKSGENYLTVYYEKLIPLLIEGIKELSAKVTALENR